MFFYTQQTNAASLSSRLSADCLSVTRLLTLNLNILLRQGLQGVGGLIYLSFLSAPLALGCCAATAFMATICVRCATIDFVLAAMSTAWVGRYIYLQ